MNSVWIIVPAYNEQSTIRQVVSGLRRFCPNVAVVDDCYGTLFVSEVLRDAMLFHSQEFVFHTWATCNREDRGKRLTALGFRRSTLEELPPGRCPQQTDLLVCLSVG